MKRPARTRTIKGSPTKKRRLAEVMAQLENWATDAFA